MTITYIGPFRESAHVHSVVIDRSKMQTSGGASDEGSKVHIAPSKPPIPPTPIDVHKIFKSLILPVTNAPKDNNLNPSNEWSWEYGNYSLKNAYIEIEFLKWNSISNSEKEEIQNHLAESNIVISETENPGVYNLSLYLLEYVDDSNAYILYDYSTEISVGFDTETEYGLLRDGEVIPIPILVRFNSDSSIDSSYRPILSNSGSYDPVTEDPLYDVSVGFIPRQVLPEKVFRDYFTKILCNSYALLQLHSSSDLSYVFPNNADIPDSIKSENVQTLSDLIVAVYYPVSNDGYPFYRKSENWSIEDKTITISEINSYNDVILVVDPRKAGLSSVSGTLNLMLLGGSGSTGNMLNTELGLSGGCPGSGDPFELRNNSYADLLPVPDTYFIGDYSLMPYVNGIQTQVWSIKNFNYPYIAYINYAGIIHEEDPYPYKEGFLYTSASPQGFDTQSGIQISAWASLVPWGSRIFNTRTFTMTTDSLSYEASPLNPQLANPSIKEARIELMFLQWEDENDKNNLLETFSNCYLSVIRVSETGYVLLLQPDQSLTRDSISDNSACVLSVYIDSDLEAELPDFINDYYPIETRHDSFTTFVTRMCTNQGGSSHSNTGNIVVKFIIDGRENTNSNYHPVVPPYVEGETISFSNELNISFLQ